MGVIVVLVILGIIGGSYVVRQSSTPKMRTALVGKQTVVQDVDYTGHVQSQRSAQLAFELSGPIIDVPVAVGDHVSAGQVLAVMDPRSSQLQVAKARADRLAGRTTTYLTWQKAEADVTAVQAENSATVEKARQAVRNTKKELDQSQVVWDRTVRESGDQASTTDAKYLAVIAARSAYTGAQKTLQQTQASGQASDTAARHTADLAKANYIATSQAAQGSSGASALQSLEDIAKLSLHKDTLFAPFDGVVTAKNIEVGELATVGAVVVTVETIDNLEFTAAVPETDSVKLAVGMNAALTFDAFTTKESIPAQVTTIAPAAKIIEGVPTFAVTLKALVPATHLKPGLTANVTVHAAQVQNAVAIPRRALIRAGNRQYVKVVEGNGSASEQDVVVGLVGSDGSVEIIKGLSGGETLVIGS